MIYDNLKVSKGKLIEQTFVLIEHLCGCPVNLNSHEKNQSFVALKCNIEEKLFKEN